MKRRTVIAHEFVEYIPEDLQEGVIYISVRFATALHKCCCGCGNQVVTPFSPVDWKLIFDGESISLDPSIGNWSFSCRSHYWIRRNKVIWARKFSRREVERGRAYDRSVRDTYFNHVPELAGSAGDAVRSRGERQKGFWKWLKGWRSKLGR
jgi:Family of unknown function (DUF6527)